MQKAYLSTRRGKIEQISLHKYEFSFSNDENNNEKKNKLKGWLTKSPEVQLYKVEENCFFTFKPLIQEITGQYKKIEESILQPPFLNLQKISSYISFHLRSHLSQHFKQYLNSNIFIIEEIKFYPFQLLKCISFNIEVFEDGNFLIHFQPISKIISDKTPVTLGYLNELKSNLEKPHDDSLNINLITQGFKRKKISLNDVRAICEIEELVKEKKYIFSTFDYHFLSCYSSQLFNEITELTLKDLKTSVLYMHPIIKDVKIPIEFNLNEEVYLKAELIDFGSSKNLILGSNRHAATEIKLLSKNKSNYGLKIEYVKSNNLSEIITETLYSTNSESIIQALNLVAIDSFLDVIIEQRENWRSPHITKVGDLNNYAKTQSGTYYTGVYKPADNAIIQPVIIGNLNIDHFDNLMLSHFNKNSNGFKINTPIVIQEGGHISQDLIDHLGQFDKKSLLVCIFCKYQQPKDFTQLLSKNKYSYQIYLGDTSPSNSPKLSNFVCKCIEKLGGLISVVKDSGIDINGCFLGIDLGHGINKTHLGLTLFDSKGVLIAYHMESSDKRNESLNKNDFLAALHVLKKKLEILDISVPDHVVVHRDGKLHSTDITTILDSLKIIWEVWEVDIIEIIKTGYPILVIKEDNRTVNNPTSGSAYVDEHHKYSILVTNTQIDEFGGSVRPLIIKHKYGEMKFTDVLTGVYWMTKVYTNNLFNSTRLPATTLKANNIVSTSDIVHQASYLG